eukprot:1136585-Pelagomonas_calceolata.AAC.2
MMRDSPTQIKIKVSRHLIRAHGDIQKTQKRREGKGYIAVPACRGSLAEAKRAYSEYVLVDGLKPARVKPARGVKQGCQPWQCPLSPLLFSLYMNGIDHVAEGIEGAVTGTENVAKSEVVHFNSQSNAQGVILAAFQHSGMHANVKHQFKQLSNEGHKHINALSVPTTFSRNQFHCTFKARRGNAIKARGSIYKRLYPNCQCRIWKLSKLPQNHTFPHKPHVCHLYKGYKGYKGKRPQSRRLTASLFINTDEDHEGKKGRSGVVNYATCTTSSAVRIVVVDVDVEAAVKNATASSLATACTARVGVSRGRGPTPTSRGGERGDRRREGRGSRRGGWMGRGRASLPPLLSCIHAMPSAIRQEKQLQHFKHADTNSTGAGIECVGFLNSEKDNPG